MGSGASDRDGVGVAPIDVMVAASLTPSATIVQTE